MWGVIPVNNGKGARLIFQSKSYTALGSILSDFLTLLAPSPYPPHTDNWCRTEPVLRVTKSCNTWKAKFITSFIIQYCYIDPFHVWPSVHGLPYLFIPLTCPFHKHSDVQLMHNWTCAVSDRDAISWRVKFITKHFSCSLCHFEAFYSWDHYIFSYPSLLYHPPPHIRMISNRTCAKSNKITIFEQLRSELNIYINWSLCILLLILFTELPTFLSPLNTDSWVKETMPYTATFKPQIQSSEPHIHHMHRTEWLAWHLNVSNSSSGQYRHTSAKYRSMNYGI